MERRGLVCRHRLDGDRKSLKVAITGKGADLLGRAELAFMKALEDIGVYEVNEAFAPVPMAWLCETGADSARLNPNGGAIAMRQPLGASGARIMTTLINYMRDNGIRYGLQTMCEGGGTRQLHDRRAPRLTTVTCGFRTRAWEPASPVPR